MKVAVKGLLRVAVVVAVVGASQLFPQKLVWSAPETRSKTFNVASGEVVDPGFPITHVAVSWDGELEADVSLRYENVNGWSAPKKVEGDTDSGQPRPTALILVDDAQRVKVETTSSDVSNLEIIAIDAEHGPRKLVPASTTPAAEAMSGHTPQPDVTTRSQWGADESLRRGTPEFADINKVIIHHTVTDNNDPNPAATVRAIYTWHTNGNGWNDIGYNFLVDQQGRIYEGRYARNYPVGEKPTGENAGGKGVIGAHAEGFNTGSVGISMLGTFTTDQPTNAQLDAVEKLVAWVTDRHNIDITKPGSVVGHRDVNQTSCPGEAAYRLLPQIRQKADIIKMLAYPPGNTPGYWISTADGKVNNYGSATNYGSMAGKRLNGQIASMTRTASGKGYWLMGTDGGIFGFGDAPFKGSMGDRKLNKPVVGMAPTPSGNGYWLVASDGGIFAFGDADFYGSMGGSRLNKPVVGMAPTSTGHGYWLVASDGGIFNFGDADFYGSMGSSTLNQPIVTMMSSLSDGGYMMVGRDGGTFQFGSIPFRGSIPMLDLKSFSGAISAALTDTGDGYYMLSTDGGVYSFGDARFHGAATGSVATGIALVPEP